MVRSPKGGRSGTTSTKIRRSSAVFMALRPSDIRSRSIGINVGVIKSFDQGFDYELNCDFVDAFYIFCVPISQRHLHSIQEGLFNFLNIQEIY